MNPETIRLLEEVVDTGSKSRRRCLDLGCGNGSAAFHLAELGWAVLGIDLALPTPLGVQVGINDLPAGEVALINADVQTVVLDEKFDAVLALGLLHSLGSWPQVEAVLRRIVNWTAPGSVVLLSWLLDVTPMTTAHAAAYFPAPDLVTNALTMRGFQRTAWSQTVIEHDHGLRLHSHRVIYSSWRRLI